MTNFKAFISLSVFSMTLILATSAEARDLRYKIGAGYQQVYSSSLVPDGGTEGAPAQWNSIVASYGIANDMSVEATFGYAQKFNSVIVGPAFRYDIQRLLSRNFVAWEYLNIFVKGAFLLKTGKDIETGITLHLPYAGFEILPFKDNGFAISTSAGVVIDFVKDTSVGFTNSQFGDVGVRYYF